MSYYVSGDKPCPNPMHNPDCFGYCDKYANMCKSCGSKRSAATYKVRRLFKHLRDTGKPLSSVRFALNGNFDISTWDPDVEDPMVGFVVEELLKR